MQFDLTRRLAAEALGTLILVMAVVGSGIMAETLGNQAVALLCNTIATGAVLFVVITIFAPVSGAHFNPAVSLVMHFRGLLDLRTTLAYSVMQIVGGCAGAILAHLMFGLDLVQLGSTARTGGGQWAGEFIATFGLIGTILGYLRFKPDAVATAVGLYITSAYWFTSSTSFANPAVTIARAEQHLCGHCAGRCAGLYRGRASRRAGRSLAVRLAVRRAYVTGSTGSQGEREGPRLRRSPFQP
jgi:glycerol uptake facilitator-like aquaporin